MRRRGVTLLELMLVLCLLGIVGSTVTAMVVAAGRMSARAMAHLAAERTAQVAAAFLRHDLAAAAWNDVNVADDAIDLRRPVGEAALCGASGSVLWLRRSGWTGDRAPDPARDQLVVWPEGGSDPVRAPILDVVGASCPDAAPAWRVTRAASDSIGGWVRVEEPTTLRRYRAGNSEWLGLSAGGAPVQPFAGPLLVGASRFARLGAALQLDLVTAASHRRIAIPLGSAP